MSNIFKNNSRFAGLIDKPEYDKSSTSVKLMKKMGWKEGTGLGKNQDGIKAPLEAEKRENNSGLGFKSDEKKNNVFKDDNGAMHNNFRERRYNRYPSEQERQRILEEYRIEEEARKEREKQEAERKKQESLTPDNFPDLVLTKKETNVIPQEQNYLEKLKKVDEVSEKNEVDEDLENLKPGWVLFKKDKLTGKLIMKGNVSVFKQPEISEEETGMNIVNALVELHQRRTEEYIELNGYDTWEKMFKFPGWREWEAEFEDDSDEEYEDESEISEEEYV